MGNVEAKSSRGVARTPGRQVLLFHGLALAGLIVVAVREAHASRWSLGTMLMISAFSIVSALTYVETGSSKIKVSGSFLGVVLAAVLLGASAAACIGILTDAVGWLRRREAGHYLRNNLLTYGWSPLIAGLFFHAAVRATQAMPSGAGYYLLVFATFVVALTLNFLAVAGYQCYLDGSSLAAKTREALIPLLPSELFAALLTMASAYVAQRMGMIGLGLFGLVLVLFQYLTGELLKSKHRSVELHRLATTDELTGLANREQFRSVLDAQIAAAKEAGGGFAVMLLDLDRFKEINDTLGHHYGDELLRELGPRLGSAIGPDGLVARLGGDEFAILAAAPSAEIVFHERLALELAACIQEPFLLDGMSLGVGASIGIARFPDDGEDGHTLLRRADVAMYAAKETSSDWKLYSPELDRHSMRRLNILSDFRRALESREVLLHYQPIVELGTGEVRGAEALMRWQHPESGLIAAGEFIQVVEQSGLIGALTRYVLEQAIAQCAEWRAAGRQLFVAVNLSVRNLLDQMLPQEIAALLASYNLPPDALALEITESMLMADPERALVTLSRLSALGVRLSVDDFGTGYSSLAYLKRMPIGELKIDRSFVSPMLEDESDLIIVRSTINLAHDLGLRVVAEGVEDEATLHHLATLGCDLAQGYHLSEAVAPAAFSAWVDAEVSADQITVKAA